jgi:hypothetical protein
MIEINKLTEADRGRIVAQRVTPHITYEGALVAWTPKHLVVAFPKHVRHGSIKTKFILELVNPKAASFTGEGAKADASPHNRQVSRKEG